MVPLMGSWSVSGDVLLWEAFLTVFVAVVSSIEVAAEWRWCYSPATCQEYRYPYILTIAFKFKELLGFNIL